MANQKIFLPIDERIPEILQCLAKSSAMVLVASPGSGKTTRIPIAALDGHLLPENKEIWVLEPRRIAAKLASTRIADEAGEPIGRRIGYQFRFENKTSASTRLTFLTEGMLMRRMISDPNLSRAGIIFIDEFHERHLHSDIALSYLRHLQMGARPELKIVVMSATLDAEPIAQFLGDCPVLKFEMPPFPLEINYAPEQTLPQMMKSLLNDSKRPPGDLLVFLAGMSDIRRAETDLARIARDFHARILPLHSEISKEDQEAALTRQNFLKIILSTNIAESSVTIDGVSTVIDSGLHRRASYSWWSGIPALRTKPISRASATQRAGRAARQGPGLCIRMYSKANFDGRPFIDVPEIKRSDLSGTLLELKSVGIFDAKRFNWFDSPETSAIDAAEKLLIRLGALDYECGPATRIGKRMSEIPASPRLARILIEAEKRGCLASALKSVAMLSEGKTDSIDLASEIQSGRSDFFIDRGIQLLSRAFADTAIKDQAQNKHLALTQSILAGFPDRVGRIRSTSREKSGEREIVLCTGGSAKVPDLPFTHAHEYFIVVDVQETQGEHQQRSIQRVRSLVDVTEDQLFEVQPSPIVETTDSAWDSQREIVLSKSYLKYFELILVEEPNSKSDTNTTPVLLRYALGADLAKLNTYSVNDWIRLLTPVSTMDELENTFARIDFVLRNLEDQNLISLSSASVSHAVENIISHCKSKAELREINWADALAQNLLQSHFAILERLAPSSLQLPSGRKLRVNYRLQTDPWVESRLQDFFGMKESPSLAGGKKRLLLHLLAPNHRAVQVTSDLSGFWTRSYPEIRKELSRKYPRHSWPEDPFTAEPPRPKPKR